MSTATLHMGCKVKLSPGKSVSFIQAFMSSTNLCSARKEISLEDSSEVWISVRHRIVKLSPVTLMRSETEWNCLLSHWLCLICHCSALISPAGFGISELTAIKRAQLGLRHFPQSQSAECESQVLCFSSEEIFLYFQCCISSLHIAKAERFCKSSWVAPAWCTHSRQTVFSFLLPVTCSRGCVIWSQVKLGQVMVNLTEQKSSLM